MLLVFRKTRDDITGNTVFTEVEGRLPIQTWYLVRHGETEWNAAARMQGRLDSPLTELGREQARAVAELLARLGVDDMFASPLGRVRESVAILHQRLAIPVRYDDRLQEWSAGDWGGELYAEIGGKWPDAWDAWNADRLTCPSPGGENFLDLITRSRSFLEDATLMTLGPRVAIVAHGFLNRALCTVLLRLPPAAMLAISQPNDTVIRISIDAGKTVADHFAGQGPIDGLPLNRAATPA
jgi:broad specificity phosphatase PhoE